VDATAQATLAAASSALFPLDTTILLADNGALHSPKLPGELFAHFTPQPKELDEDVARRAIDLVHHLDPVTIAVFEKFCCDGLTASRAAQQLKMSKTAVVRRLNKIRAKTGMAPTRLRALSPYFARIERTLSDARAATIHRKDLL
jgi:hypothetical protein